MAGRRQISKSSDYLSRADQLKVQRTPIVATQPPMNTPSLLNRFNQLAGSRLAPAVVAINQAQLLLGLLQR